jgi:hypothetical protein
MSLFCVRRHLTEPIRRLEPLERPAEEASTRAQQYIFINTKALNSQNLRKVSEYIPYLTHFVYLHATFELLYVSS